MIINKTPQTEIARIFLDPNITPHDNRRPLLYLLRRDLQNQYGKENDPPGRLISPLLTCLGIMVGIELLTKYWSGNHEAGNSDVEKFLQDVGGLSENSAIALTQLRHAIAHGYKLQTIRKKDNQKYSFALSDDINATDCIVDQGNFSYLINIWKLKELFLKTINNLKTILEASPDLQATFTIVQAYIKDFEIQ